MLRNKFSGSESEVTFFQGIPDSALSDFLKAATAWREQGRFDEIWSLGHNLPEHNEESHFLLGLAAADRGFPSDAGAHYRAALQKTRDPALRRQILVAAASVLPDGQAVVALNQALQLAGPGERVDLLVWKSEIEVRLGAWSKASESLNEAWLLAPQKLEIRHFLEEVYIYQGRYQEALEVLRESTSLSSLELFRKTWLLAPNQRAKPLKPVQPVLHALYGTKALNDVTITCIGPLPEDLLERLKQFHSREFSGHQLQFEAATAKAPQESFETLRDLIDVGELPEWAVGERFLMVAAKAQNPTPYTAGIGSPGMMVLSLTRNDPFQATIVAHELYHSLLDLNHSNGTEGPDDPGSVMGPWGSRIPVEVAYVNEFHRTCCTTTQEVQALVEAEEFEKALLLDPHYLGLYAKVAEQKLSQGMAEGAVEILKRWVQVDPGPEAMARLGELLIRLERDPSMIFRSCRGFETAANTHLYLAQCYLNCYAFEGALQQLRTAQKLEPDNLHALGMTGWALHGAGHFEQAELQYGATLERCPGWESVLGRLAWLRGEEYSAPHPSEELLWLEAVTSKKSEALLRKLGNPVSAKLLLQKAVHLFQNGQEPESIACFEAVIPICLHSLETKASQAWLFYLRGHSKDAEEQLQAVLDFWPGEPSCRYLRSILNPS